ncbi:hypothetical protein [Kitasatospora sp. NPDC097643]|uniref:hypothetical protein n=1 Tax=Kitasatospora sp. NPDC097643 TaxID=3157230 RepID=UPI0033342D3C
MTSLLKGFLGKASERWATQLGLPGLLFLTLCWSAYRLGHADALNVRLLLDGSADVVDPAARSDVRVAVRLALGVVFAALAATVVGLAVRELGSVVQKLWLGEGRWGLGRARTDPVTGASAPTSGIGARFGRLHGDIGAYYSLDLAAAWPRLWLVLPESARADLTTVSAGFRQAAEAQAWGLLCLPVACWWWPAAVPAAVLIATGWGRGRAAAEEFATLVESVVDVHGAALATALGFDCPDGRLTPETGQRVSDHLARRRPLRRRPPRPAAADPARGPAEN